MITRPVFRRLTAAIRLPPRAMVPRQFHIGMAVMNSNNSSSNSNSNSNSNNSISNNNSNSTTNTSSTTTTTNPNTTTSSTTNPNPTPHPTTTTASSSSNPLTPEEEYLAEIRAGDHTGMLQNRIYTKDEVEAARATLYRHQPLSLSDRCMHGLMYGIYNSFNFVTRYRYLNPEVGAIEWRLLLLGKIG